MEIIVKHRVRLLVLGGALVLVTAAPLTAAAVKLWGWPLPVYGLATVIGGFLIGAGAEAARARRRRRS